MLRLLIVLCLLPSFAPPPPASDTKPTDAPTAPADSTPDHLLSGPKVEPQSTRPTLVHRTFDGQLEEIGSELDAAAIAELPLTDEQRREYDRIVLARHTIFDRLVGVNYRLITELGAALAQQDRESSVELLRTLRDAFEEFSHRGSFIDEMSPHLTIEQRRQVRDMVEEYVKARIAKIQQELGPDAPPQRMAIRLRLESFGHMVRESIERQVGLGREEFDRLVEKLELTPEQANRAQAIFGPLAVKQLQRQATPADTAAALRDFSAILTPAQRSQLLGLLIEYWKPEPAPKLTTPPPPVSTPEAKPPAMP